MNRREAVVIMAVTGTTTVTFDLFHKYTERLLGRPIWTHEFASESLWEQIKDAAMPEFLDICKRVDSLAEEPWETEEFEYTPESYARGMNEMADRLPKDKPTIFIKVADEGGEENPDRCPDCGGMNGRHGLVHVRHGNGGGHNELCPRAAEEI